MALVLIVDDSPTEVHVMQKAPEEHGFRTASASDGTEAIRKARELHPDLILMDIVMPGLNGFQATRQLANDPQTRTMRARGNPRELLAQSSDPAVREFLTRGEPAGKAKPLNPILL